MAKAKQQQKRETWRQRVTEYRASGQSGSTWCAAQGIKPHLLYYWTQQFASPPEACATSKQRQPGSVSGHQHEKAPGIIMVRVGAATIEILPDFNAKVLGNVVRVLAAVC
jgi:hypothetical protein